MESVKQRLANGGTIKLAYLAFDDDIGCECYGNEAVYQGAELVGLTTGGVFGHRVGFSLAFAYIKPERVVQDAPLQVMTSAGMRCAHVETAAVYDPGNEKLRG